CDTIGRWGFSWTVGLEDPGTGPKEKYQIGGDDEADLDHGLISVGSPIARALIGKSEGDVAAVQAPGGVREYEIISVQFV
ncbi:GreA/GreB family elongation factor, partial [Burkholderia pseudomallei]|uniref:GreA/GreB family elongation factor n=1 Tax=Burkholderia pseudomallei TaxID=28450 RepID=UPI000CCE51C9